MKHSAVVPFSLKDAPALIEQALPVQRLSIEAYKEQMAGSGKSLTPLGSYWKGRKALVLNKACILGSLLPATDDLARDLEIFEMLMGMDPSSIKKRLQLSQGDRVPDGMYRDLVSNAKRAEELGPELQEHIWDDVNAHLGTSATNMPSLVEQLGIMRFGRRPKLADTFSGSGQIPFEAARLGCDVYASDLNPIACLLTWGAFNIAGATPSQRSAFDVAQIANIDRVRAEIDRLGIETDGAGWRAKVFLYCAEVTCPQTGWKVPLLPSFVISKPRTGDRVNVAVELVPDQRGKRYEIRVRSGIADSEIAAAEKGTVRSDGRGQDPYMIHTVDGKEYKTKISTLRGDHRRSDGSNGNRLRMWEQSDFVPRESDLFQERLYVVQWLRRRATGRDEHQFRAVSDADLRRERTATDYVREHLSDWQARGIIPDMRIEPGEETTRLTRERGWTHWHHLFAPRQLLVAALANETTDARLKFGVLQLANWNSRLCRWNIGSGGGGSVQDTFYNQTLNTLYNFGCRGFELCADTLKVGGRVYPLPTSRTRQVESRAVADLEESADIFVTDPPYGDAVSYHEILDFFIAWMRKQPPPEFSGWTWDSRRALAIKGEDEEFRRAMVAGYSHLCHHMADDGLQIIMFTHQSGEIWADMANIVWAAGLKVTAAWYVVTESESALRDGAYVKGTVLLVLRKRTGVQRTTRDDLAWDLKEEVEQQVAALTGLNQQISGRYRDENMFADADLQMAGYAAALRVLTRFSVIDGKDMASEAIRPRVRGQTTFVDELIGFAVGVANQSLVPTGIDRAHWDKLRPAERFYMKLLELESQGARTLDNYQNFAKAFKVVDFRVLMADSRANSSRLKSAVELGRAEMSDASELAQTMLRGVLYAAMELVKGVDGADVLAHLSFNVEGFFDPAVRGLLVALSDFLAAKLVELRPEEASAARVLSELVKSQTI